MRVLHIAYGHIKNDIRIVQKECTSLINAGYEVYYTTHDNPNDITKSGAVKYIPLKAVNDSLLVNYFINKDLLKEYCNIIEKIQPQIVHIHEYGISFMVRYIKRHYKEIKVIYDVHEDNAGVDYERDIQSYGKMMARILVWLRKHKERQACRYADVVLPATLHIEELLEKYSSRIEVIYNYPIIKKGTDAKNREKQGVCYVGGLTEDRGITELVSISGDIRENVYLAGPVDEDYLLRLKQQYADTYNKKWFYQGTLKKEDVDELYTKSRVGICTLKKTINCFFSLPIKLFEYMEAGIPVIVSDFPLWRKIVEEAQCGICVDEENPAEICDGINYLISHPEEAARMGANGRKAVKEKYNWDSEEKKLLQIYQELMIK